MTDTSPEITPETSGGILLEETKNMKLFRCPCCTGTWTIYKIHFSTHHVRILEKIFKHCVKYKTHEIDKNTIADLTASDYTNFCHLQRFGFIYWIRDEYGVKQKGGKWGVAVKRIRQFLGGEWAVAEYTEKDTRTKEQRSSKERVFIHEIKRYSKHLEKDRPEWLPYFVTYDSDPFDQNQEGFHVSK